MSEAITSASNTKIKLVRALQSHNRNRKTETAFVAEGVRLVEEAVAVHWPLAFILYDDTLSDRGKALVSSCLAAQVCEVAEVSPQLMKEISDTETPQGILAVCRQQTFDLPLSPTFLLLVDQVRDPGNLGTILRTAEAVGVEAVLLTPGTVDAYSPKVIRAGMGAHFHLPILLQPWEDIQSILKDLPIFLADSSAGLPMWEADFSQPCTLLVGGEAFGASPMGEQLATKRVTIPMRGRAESLNAAMAAGILMAEVLRQRATTRKG